MQVLKFTPRVVLGQLRVSQWLQHVELRDDGPQQADIDGVGSQLDKFPGDEVEIRIALAPGQGIRLQAQVPGPHFPPGSLLLTTQEEFRPGIAQRDDWFAPHQTGTQCRQGHIALRGLQLTSLQSRPQLGTARQRLQFGAAGNQTRCDSGIIIFRQPHIQLPGQHLQGIASQLRRDTDGADYVSLEKFRMQIMLCAAILQLQPAALETGGTTIVAHQRDNKIGETEIADAG